MPRERARLPTCVVGDFPDFEKPEPLLLLERGEWAKDYVAGWSEYYKMYPREPWLDKEIQLDSHAMYQWTGRPQNKPSPDDCFPGGRAPGWELAPQWIYQQLVRQQQAIADK